MLTMTLQHSWVKHTVTKVSAIPDLDDDTRVVVIEDQADIDKAEEEAAYGCDVCGVPMEGNTDTTCNPTCHCGVTYEEHHMSSPYHDFVAQR